MSPCTEYCNWSRIISDQNYQDLQKLSPTCLKVDLSAKKSAFSASPHFWKPALANICILCLSLCAEKARRCSRRGWPSFGIKVHDFKKILFHNAVLHQWFNLGGVCKFPHYHSFGKKHNTCCLMQALEEDNPEIIMIETLRNCVFCLKGCGQERTPGFRRIFISFFCSKKSDDTMQGLFTLLPGNISVLFQFNSD